MIKAVIFDVDGVIFDSEEIHYATEAETMQAIGIPLTVDDIRHYSGVRLEEEFLDITKKFNKQIDLPKVIEIRDEILRKKIQKGFPTVPHVKEVIKDLSTQYALAVASSGERRFIDKELHMAKLSGYFTAFVYGEDVTHPKPHPQPYLKAAAMLGVAPSECVAIEDSPSGFQAVKSAGMTLIARKGTHNKQKDFSIADYSVKDLRDIPDIIEKINLQAKLSS